MESSLEKVKERKKEKNERSSVAMFGNFLTIERNVNSVCYVYLFVPIGKLSTTSR